MIPSKLTTIIVALGLLCGCSKQDPRLPYGFEIVTDGTNYAYVYRSILGDIEGSRTFTNCEAAIAECIRIHEPERPRLQSWRPATCD